jgi:hypothetical protein
MGDARLLDSYSRSWPIRSSWQRGSAISNRLKSKRLTRQECSGGNPSTPEGLVMKCCGARAGEALASEVGVLGLSVQGA